MKRFFLLILPLSILVSCKTASSITGNKDNGKIDVTFLQINDVYEIAPLGGGKEGGIARVATLKKEYLQKNPNTFLVIAGDFVSPSVYNSLQVAGKAVRGKQMVEALGSAGLDYAMFGNHEFDIKESELQDRIDESSFGWISSNAFHKTKSGVEPFVKEGKGPLPKTFILRVKDADGTTAKIGMLALTGPFNKADFVSYTDVMQAAKEAYNALKDSSDVVIAITHQSMDADELLAKEVPGLTAIIGGHEHDGRYAKVAGIPITKAVANAKNAYVIQLRINKKKGTHNVKTSIETLNEKVALDSATNVVVQKWNRIAEENYGSLGFDAKKVMIEKGEPLEGRETAVRSRPTNLTQLIVAAIKDAAPRADIAVMNGGSIRVDDVLQSPVTQYDILRTLPFGGALSEADMKGSLVIKMLEAGRKNIGSGGFLQYSENLAYVADKWILNGQAIDPAKTYRMVLPEFVFSGKEANMDFLKPDNVDVVKVYPTAGKGEPLSDIRLAVVRYLEKNKAQYMK
ncbi:bifunctional metallophosphatase/5'-nucleotidase [Flavisolibacter ginsenosidimutans]|nr:bifunctional UDP-sugar hydrolase/5'-nucleotidase [Flavisolibacter ginsenosidimutans]